MQCNASLYNGGVDEHKYKRHHIMDIYFRGKIIIIYLATNSLICLFGIDALTIATFKIHTITKMSPPFFT